MKAKVIMFKQNGNEIKQAFVNLTKWFDKVYYTEPDPEDYNSIDIVIEHNGIFAYIDRTNETQLTDRNKEMMQNFVADIENSLFNKRWINLVDLEFAKQAGLNYERLLQRREDIIKRREESDAKAAKEKEGRQKEHAKQYHESMVQIKNSLKEGKVLRADNIAEAMAHFKYKVHPRTLGTIHKLNGVIGINSATKPKGMNWNTHSSIIETVKEFANS